MSTSKNAINPTKSGELNYVLVIHGGTIGMPQEDSTPENPATYKAALSQALNAGYNVLKHGGEAMDAVIAAVSAMEGGDTLLYTNISALGG
jgi:beta-aspartyl-peptidase (threonine type)